MSAPRLSKHCLTDLFCRLMLSSIENYIQYCSTGETALRLDTATHADHISALVVYEYFITIDQEVNIVWKRSMNISSLLLLGVRWVMIAYVIIVSPPSDSEVMPDPP